MPNIKTHIIINLYGETVTPMCCHWVEKGQYIVIQHRAIESIMY